MKKTSISRILLAAIPLVVCQLLASATYAAAQSSNNGLAGTWRVQVTVDNCSGIVLRTFPALFAFANGGTLTLTTAGVSPALSTPGLGVWAHTHGHSYSAVSEAFVFNAAGAWVQTQRLTREIEVGKDGDEFTDTIALEIFDTNGQLIGTGCGSSVASRFE